MSLALLWPPDTSVPPSFTLEPWYQLVVKGDGGDDVMLEYAIPQSHRPRLSQVGAAEVLVPNDDPGLRALTFEGEWLHGPDSPTLELFCDAESMGLYYLDEPENPDLHAGWVTLHLADLAGHAAHAVVGDESLEDILPADFGGGGDGLSAWKDINCTVAASSGPTVEDASAITGMDPDDPDYLPGANYQQMYAKSVPAVGDSEVLVRCWCKIPAGSKPPKTLLQLTLYNTTTGASEQFGVGYDKAMPRDQWIRLEGKFPVADGRERRVACNVGKGTASGPIHYTKPVMCGPQGVVLGPGATGSNAVAALFNEAFNHVGLAFGATVPLTASAISASGHEYPDGRVYETTEKTDIWSAITSEPSTEWYMDPRSRIVYVGGTDGIGTTRTDITFGTDGRDGNLTSYSVPSDGMVTRWYMLGPDADEAREMAVVSRAALHPWEDASTVAPAGTWQTALGSWGVPLLAESGKSNRMVKKVDVTPPPWGRCPADWLLGDQRLTIGDHVPTRVVDGPHVDYVTETRIIGFDVDCVTGELTALVL